MNFTKEPEFQRELKKLKKRFRSLDEDIDRLEKVLIKLPQGTGGKHWNCIHKNERANIYKVRLACTSLHEKRMRIIYAHYASDTLVVFIELYFKGDKENEDRERIKVYLKNSKKDN